MHDEEGLVDTPPLSPNIVIESHVNLVEPFPAIRLELEDVAIQEWKATLWWKDLPIAFQETSHNFVATQIKELPIEDREIKKE